MRITKLVCAILISLMCQFAFAANTKEIASQVVDIKAVRLNNQLTHANQTEIFMDLQNTGSISHTVIAAYSPIAEQIQFHQSIKHGKSMLMQPVKSILIAPHKDEDLHYGGLHLMLIGLKQPLTNHEKIPLTLIFNDGSWLTVDASVFSAPPTA